MLPLEVWPGHDRWKDALPELLRWEGPLWIFGESGSGVSTFGRFLADRRASPYLDDVDRLPEAEVANWLRDHSQGILMAHLPPEHPAVVSLAKHALAFRLATFEEDPGSAASCATALAQELGLDTLPSALYALPCPGNLRGLHNRLTRFKLLGQLPDLASMDGEGTFLPIRSEDLASNLHALERLLLHRALRRSYGNRMEAARRLGVSRRQLYLLVARHGDPLRGEVPTADGPKRLLKRKSTLT
jgi:hypothetical protein